MRFTLVTNIISPHQLPLARQLVARLGAAQFRYVAITPLSVERAQLGWVNAEQPPWLLESWRNEARAHEAERWIQEADVVLCGNRDLGLFERRLAERKLLLYMAERWFLPPIGMGRLLHPRFLRMALRFRRLARSPHFHHLAIGLPAVRDMRVVCRLPGRSWLWGYFVDPPAAPAERRPRQADLRILWAGRMLGWKRVDTLIRAVAICREQESACQLRLIGCGEQETALRQLARRLGCYDSVTFEPPVPVAQVREALRQTDVYVLPSNGCEGWGVALNEAMLEGACVVASPETGSAQTLVRDGANGLLFRPGDVQGLAQQLLRLARDEPLRQRLAAAGRETILSAWTPDVAAERLLAFSEALIAGRTPPVYTEGPLQRI